jgi:hypothetical protein
VVNVLKLQVKHNSYRYKQRVYEDMYDISPINGALKWEHHPSMMEFPAATFDYWKV